MVTGRTLRWMIVALTLVAGGCGELVPIDPSLSYTSLYIVQRGETLYSIAFNYGYDYREVAAWNNIPPPYTIYPGQTLRLVPPFDRAPPTPASPTTAPTTVASAPAPDNAVATAAPVPTRTFNTPRPIEIDPGAPTTSGIGWQWPTLGKVEQGFNPADNKKGLDIGGKSGQLIKAAAAGSVVYSGAGLLGYGNLVIIKHDDTYLSAYGHNKTIYVKEGDTVRAGQTIAEMGDTAKDGPILHFEIRKDGKPVDPLQYLPSRTQ